MKHRKPCPPRPLTPLVSAGAALACMWLPLATSPATASAVTDTTRGPAVLERTAVLQRATRAARPVPVWVKAVQAALTKLGRPYVWGSKGPNSFDCSGLIQWAYRQAGVNLGPDTYSQVRQGIPVTQVRAGDVVFPARSFNGRGPGHVVLAISTTQAVEAPGRGMTVRVIPLPAGVARRVA